VVWLTPRNALSTDDGLDVYGRFLNRDGLPVGDEFRISDLNTAARNGPPAVAAGKDGFAVAWTRRGSSCTLGTQWVSSAAPAQDILISAAGQTIHSPSLVYDSGRSRFLLAYVQGADYLPPTALGAATADCGDDPASLSQVKALALTVSGSELVPGTPFAVSAAGAGAFRPRAAFSPQLDRYLLAWEDRRNAASQPFAFGVYARRLSGDLTPEAADLELLANGDYTNYDADTTWTPRPTVAGGADGFLAAWFSRETQNTAVVWSVQGRLVPAAGSPAAPLTLARMTFAQPHSGQSPTGFLASSYAWPAREYLVAVTSQLESVWGYISSLRVQRLTAQGGLLRLDGTAQSQPGVGYLVDYETDDQVSAALAVDPAFAADAAAFLIAYGKHDLSQPAQDFDIWGVQVRLPAAAAYRGLLPVVRK
jgi:hypothetical protein